MTTHILSRKANLHLFVLFLIGMLAFAFSSTPASAAAPQDVAPPRNLPEIQANPTSGVAPLTVTFSAIHMSLQSDVSPNYSWDFGTGDSSSNNMVVYTFKNPGTYWVTLTITDAAGEHVAKPVKISVFAGESGCASHCLVSNSVSLKDKSVGDTTFIAGSVYVIDERGLPVAGATVIGTWTLPNGHQVTVKAETNRSGYAELRIPVQIYGLYSLQIDGLEKTGYQFDESRGDLSAEINY